MKKPMICLALCTSVFAKTAMVPPQSNLSRAKLQYLEMQRNYKTNAKGDILEKLDFAAEPKNWFNLSPIVDGVEGVATEAAYKRFGNPKSEIIVAVIDSGVDVNHEDLQGRIWINSDEIADNGIDDDGNGYIDDVFGWNFIGGEKGIAKIIKDNTLPNGYKLIKGDPRYQVDADTLEVTREVLRLRKLKAELNQIGYYLTAEERMALASHEAEVEREYQTAKPRYDEMKTLKDRFDVHARILKATGINLITEEALASFKPSNPQEEKAKTELMQMIELGYDETSLLEDYNYYLRKVTYYDLSSNTRVEIVGDNEEDVNEKIYGNNDVIGPDSSHGTHVAGTIAANRLNAIGMKGVANNAKIMAIRCVPNGDERDKDVANSIRYAVDNGAKIINMSFGKSYSPNKEVVDAAIKYAQEKGVMLVHAAGNEFQNTDLKKKFPNKYLTDGGIATNWMEIGASAYQKGQYLAASFSNYGKATVDLFAPGRNIYATFPNNEYKAISGTSMATPVVSGVLAMVLGYEDVSMETLRDIAMNTTSRYPGLEVFKRGLGYTLFSNLSASGGIINIENILVQLNVSEKPLVLKRELANN